MPQGECKYAAVAGFVIADFWKGEPYRRMHGDVIGV